MVLKANWSGLVDRMLEFFPLKGGRKAVLLCLVLVSGREPESFKDLFTTIDIVTMALLIVMEGLVINAMSEEEAEGVH